MPESLRENKNRKLETILFYCLMLKHKNDHQRFPIYPPRDIWKIIFNLVGRPAAWIDKNLVDGTVNGIAWTTGKISVLIKGMQSGRVQSYALFFFGGIICLVIIFLYLWK